MQANTPLFSRVKQAAATVLDRLNADDCEVAVVLSSGLAAASEQLEGATTISYGAVPGMPETTVSGQPGRLACGLWGGRKALVFLGRVHAFEGYGPADLGFGVRVAAMLGVRTLVTTDLAGAITPALQVGQVTCTSDHLNLSGIFPLSGPNDERLGPRFIDMSDAYDPGLRAVAVDTSRRLFGAPLPEVVYGAMPGPSYETPAEVRMLQALGADVVGMSLVHDVIVARHAGMRVLALALVSDRPSERPALTHSRLTATGVANAARIGELLSAVLPQLPPPGAPTRSPG